MILAILAFGQIAVRQELIVFSAQRYGENLRNIFSIGAAHLYLIREDGFGLRQLTSGDFDDVQPTVAKSRKEILFWRADKSGSDLYNATFHLWSIRLDGTNLRRLGAAAPTYPPDGLALAMEQADISAFKKAAGTGSLYDYLRTTKDDSEWPPRLSPDGRRTLIVANKEDPPSIVENVSGTVTEMDRKFILSTWIDNRTIAAFVVPTGSKPTKQTVVFLDTLGRVVRRCAFPIPEAGEQDTFDASNPDFSPHSVHGYRFAGSNRFLLQAHHPMSDGGYDFCYLFDMKTGRSTFVASDTVEAVSPSGRGFLTARYDWFGGYKGAGSAKLCKLYFWNQNTMKANPIGFRRMDCYGACFISDL